MEFLAALEVSPVARALTRWPVLYIAASSAHILSFAVMLGTILLHDLRVLGFLKALPLAAVASLLPRFAGVALAMTLATGFLLFSVRPLDYLGNTAFQAKLALIALGLANVAAVHASRGWRVVLDGGPPGSGVRLGALISLLVWISALVAGRWIGFL